MRPILWVPTAKELPKDGGTRIEVKLKHKSGDKHGLLHSSHWSLARYSLARVVAAVAPNLDVALYVQEDTKVGGVSTPGDWLKPLSNPTRCRCIRSHWLNRRQPRPWSPAGPRPGSAG